MREKGVEPDFFPMAVWYSGGKARAPMLSINTPGATEEWQEDLKQIKALGFNTVRTWVEWAHCEPRRGEYNFDNLRLLCELAQKVGLKVFIQMYVDSAPDWVGRAYPEAQFEAQSGEKVPPQAAPGVCIDHKGVRAAVLKFFTETAKVAVRYPNFYGWDVWSEPHIINWAIINYVPGAQFCFCPFTRKRFQLWLKRKYGTLKELNRAWYRTFESWEEVEPPRFGTILSYTDFIDWKTFIYDKLAEDLGERCKAIRQIDSTHVITSHAAVPSIFTSPFEGDGAADDFLMAEQVDFYGTSIYPKHSFPQTHWSLLFRTVAVDFTRSANMKNGGFYIGELQGGYGVRGLICGDPVTAEDLRTWMWSILAKGARAINIYAYYPMSSGYEAGGYGLIQLDGTATERAKTAGQIARIVTSNMSLFLQSKPVKAQIAILYNPLAQMIGGEQHSGPPTGFRDSLLGYYRVFMEHNIPVDFIHRRQLDEGADLTQYKLLLIPYPVMFKEKAAVGLTRYIQNGGFAVAEARLAWNDERGHASEIIPGMGLSKVFGVRETWIKMTPDYIPLKVKSSEHPALRNMKRNGFLRGTFFAEAVEVINALKPASILATLSDRSPVIVASTYGRGQTIFIGTLLGMAQYQAPTPENTAFILGLAEWAGVERRVRSSYDGKSDTPIEIRLQKSKAGTILFAINHSEQKQKVQIKLKVDNSGRYIIRNLITNAKITKNISTPIIQLIETIPAKNALVLHIEH